MTRSYRFACDRRATRAVAQSMVTMLRLWMYAAPVDGWRRTEVEGLAMRFPNLAREIVAARGHAVATTRFAAQLTLEQSRAARLPIRSVDARGEAGLLAMSPVRAEGLFLDALSSQARAKQQSNVQADGYL